ncbi:MAG: MFS transporter [Labedaea sp.]
MRRNQLLLLAGLGIDNFGSGLFLPLSVLYAHQVVGLPLGSAGSALTLGALFGLAVPPVAGRSVDRVGPRTVLITSQLVQAAGALGFLMADGFGSVLLAAALLVAGQQLFYCSVFALIADVAGDGAKERAFALANMVRSACFGLGALVVGALLAGIGVPGYRLAIAADGVSFVVAALLLTTLTVANADAGRGAEVPERGGVLRDRPYLALIVLTGCAVFAVDFFLVGFPVYVLDRLHGPAWLPGLALASSTALTSVGGTLALRGTRRLTRIDAMRLGSALYAAWCGLCLAAPLLPAGWRPGYLLATIVVLATATVVFSPRATALSVAAAPRTARGRYLGAYQLAYTVANVLTPLVVGLLALAAWLPWVLVAGAALLAVAGLKAVGARLPEVDVGDPHRRGGGSGGSLLVQDGNHVIGGDP